MKESVQSAMFDSKNDLEIQSICKDWERRRMEAIESTPFDDIGRVLQETDNLFNEVIDFVVYSRSIETAP